MDSLRLLASENEEKRRRLLSLRLRAIVGLPEAKRINELEDLMNLLGELPEKDRVTIYRTLIGLLPELGKDKVKLLKDTLKKITKKWSLKRKLEEKKIVIEATKDFSFLERTAIRAYLNKLF
ncbi:MAG: hypothetical protein PHD26_05345 [Methanosarcinaceae archaeon]|nr:hypothetical protein [Methanosarcinaceae archaeon]